MFRVDTFQGQSVFSTTDYDGIVDPLKIAGCVTPARRVFARFTLAAKENERNGAGQVPAGGCSSPLRAAYPENSKKVRRGRLNSRRKLRRAFSTLRFVPWRQIGECIDRGSSPQRRGRNNISPGAVARCENRSCRDGESVRNGTERPGPAPLIPPADQKGKKRNDEVPTHAARYLTGQSISLSREIIPGGDDGENYTFGPDNYVRVYRLYVLQPVPR